MGRRRPHLRQPRPVVGRNPVCDRATGTIWLPTTWNQGDDPERQIVDQTSRDTCRVFLTHSDGEGLTWAPPAESRRTSSRPGAGLQLVTPKDVRDVLVLEAGTRLEELVRASH